MPTSSAPSTSELVQRARALYPLLDSASPRIESERRLPDDVVSALKASRLFRLCVPERYAGLEASPVAMVEVIAELARADGSAGWCVAIGATSGLLGGYLADADAKEVYASDPDSVAGGVFAPKGKATTDGDAYRASGRWAFASGVTHCSWLMGGCVIFEDGKPVLLPGGVPDSRLVVFRAEDATVHDTWTVSGLCGTGSHDMEITNLVVPRSRSVSLMSDRPRVDSPLYKFPVFGCLAAGIAAVSLGLARRAIDELVELAGGKTPAASRRLLVERPTIQLQIAEAEAAERSARAFLVGTIGEIYEHASRGHEMDVRQRALLRLAATSTVIQSKRAVDAMYEAGGGSSIYKSSPLQRCFRDVHTASQHMIVSSSTLELAGRVLAGVETEAWQL